MNKKLLSVALSFGVLLSVQAKAQLAFWSYDDYDNASQIPSECDGVFDTSRGGVFVPTADEMFEKGEEFLLNANPIERNKAGYCLIGAALQGNVRAQYRVAQLYNKGFVLPQDDLSAYRWAFLASLNGNEDAGRLALLLERFLTTEEIELATSSLSAMLPNISSRYKTELEAQQQKVDQKQKELDAINKEIDTILGLKPQTTSKDVKDDSETSVQEQVKKAVPTGSIFTEVDRIR
jgi:TPR repeat protein